MLIAERPTKTHDDRNGALAPAQREIRLMIVDDHPAVRFGLAQLLEGQPDFNTEAVCIDADGAIAHAAARRVDVAVVDYQLPGRNGLWVCRQLKQMPSPPAVIVFSAFADHYLAACCAVAGADAVLNKGALGSELCDAIRSVARGRRLQPRVPQPVADMLRRKLSEPEQLLFGMLLAAIPHDEIIRALRTSEPELASRISTMLRTLEAFLDADPYAGRSRSPLDLDRRVARRRRATPMR